MASPEPSAAEPPGQAPRVSVIIPIYNRIERVPDLIATLEAQTLQDWEAIFVDDGSARDVAAALAPYLSDPRIRIKQLDRNRGVSAARNEGVRLARGDYVAFLDSDDAWAAEKLAKQVTALDACKPGPGFCVTLTTVAMPGGWERIRPNFDPKPGQSFAEYLYSDGGFAQVSSLMTDRALALQRPFREALRQYEDHLFFIELDDAGAKYGVVREALTTWLNDARPDRLSASDSIDKGLAFLAVAGTLMSPKARTAFRLRVLGAPLFKATPIAAAALVVRAFFERALPPRDIAMLVARNTMPAPLWDRLRRSAA